MVPRDPKDLLRRARSLRDRTRDSPSTTAFQELAAFEAAAGDPAAAVDDLKEATRIEPADASLRADFWAASLWASLESGSSSSIIAAADGLLALGETASARCNSAIALAALGLAHRATVHAPACGQVNPRISSVLDSARRRASVRPGSGTALATGEATAILESSRQGLDACAEQAPACLQKIRAILELSERDLAAVPVTLGGRLADREFLDLAARYANVTGNPQPLDGARHLASAPRAQIQTLSSAAEELREGSELLGRYEAARARPLFESAAKKLDSVASPWATTAHLAVASCDYQLGDLRAVEEAAVRLGSDAAAKRFPAVRARTLWSRALAVQARGDWSGALVLLEEGAAVYRRLGEPSHEGWLLALQGLSLSRLERYAEAEDSFVRSMALLTRAADTRRLAGALIMLAESLERSGFRRIAVEMRYEALAWDRLEGNPTLVADSLVGLAGSLHAVGREAEAVSILEEAKALLATITDSGARRRVETLSHLASAGLLVQTDPARAVDSATALLREIESFGEIHVRIEGLRIRAQAHSALGEKPSALADLTLALEESERQARAIRDPEEARQFRDSSRKVLEELVELLVASHDGESEALAWIERSRRAQLGAQPAQADRRANPMRTEPPEGTCVTTYFLVRSKMLAWTACGGSGWRMSSSPVDEGALRSSVGAFVAAARSGTVEELRAASRGPSEALLDPIWSLIQGARTWTVVPDARVADVPWSWLVIPGDRRFLVEAVATQEAPALSVLRFDRGRTRATEARFLGVGVGEASSGPDSSTPRLRFVENEVRAASTHFRHAIVLVECEATREVVLEALARAQAFHLAAHILPEQRAGAGPSIELAGEPGEARSIDLSDVRDLDLAHLELAFLAGCSSAEGRQRAIAGSNDLAREMILKGAASVVASKWDLEDADYSGLVDEFYRQYEGGLPVAAALREAMLSTGLHLSDRGSNRGARSFAVISSTLPAIHREGSR